ncbi:MAG: hypothetical protein GON13_03440 [Nanoarchaeota archaeon]|nr:hypothetical protein [Nanoarchaeota archaeon]
MLKKNLLQAQISNKIGFNNYELLQQKKRKLAKKIRLTKKTYDQIILEHEFAQIENKERFFFCIGKKENSTTHFKHYLSNDDCLEFYFIKRNSDSISLKNILKLHDYIEILVEKNKIGKQNNQLLFGHTHLTKPPHDKEIFHELEKKQIFEQWGILTYIISYPKNSKTLLHAYNMKYNELEIIIN